MASISDRAKGLRYKRPALASLGYDTIVAETWDIAEACGDVQYYMDRDDDTLLNAMDGDQEDEYEFKMAFFDLGSKAELLQQALNDNAASDYFDNCTVALIGNRYNTVGYDCYEEDYFALTGYDKDLAFNESGKRLMQKTKAEIISIVGQCLGITIAFLDLRQKYDYLKATMDILRGENTSLLMVIKDIETAYRDIFADGKPDGMRYFERLVSQLPDRIWIE